MVTTIQMLSGPARNRSRIRLLGAGAGSTYGFYEAYADGGSSGFVDEPGLGYEDARGHYIERLGELSSLVGTYLVLYKSTAQGKQVIAATGDTSLAPTKLYDPQAPITPPSTEPTGSKATFWAKNKWYILGGAGVVALGATAVALTRRHR